MSIRRVTGLVALLCAGAMTGLVAMALAEQVSSVTLPSSAAGPSPSEVPSSPEQRTEPASTVTIKEGRLSVLVANRPLDWILEEVSREGEVAIIRDRDLGRRRVTVQFRDLPLDEGLRQILRDHDAIFFYGVEADAPASLRAVWVYPKGRGRGLQPIPPETWASTTELEGRLADPDPEVRARAVAALVQRTGDQARDAVLEALKDQDDRVRTQALYQALNANVELPTDALSNLALSDPSPDVRFLALDALARAPEARTIAETALNDPSPHIQNKAREILRGPAATRSGPRSQPAQRRSPQPNRRAPQ